MHSLNVLINKVLPYEPDIVVLKNNCNDLSTLMYTYDIANKGYWNTASPRSLIVFQNKIVSGEKREIEDVLANREIGFCKLFPNICRSGYISYLQIARKPSPFDEWKDVRGKKLTVNVEKIKLLYRKSLESFIRICETWNIKPVLMTQAYVGHGKSIPDLKPGGILEFVVVSEFESESKSYIASLQHEFNRIVREVAEDNQVFLIDLAKEIPTSDHAYIFDSVHYNTKGSILVADVISGALVEVIEGDVEY